MTGIDRLSPATPIGSLQAGSGHDARSAAAQAIGEIGHRTLAWAGAVGGSDAGAAAWSARTGNGDGFVPDRAALAGRGDVYGLKPMAADIAARFGATPTQEGALSRALEDFTRAAMVQVAGLSGAGGERQVAGLGDALAGAQARHGDGIDGVVDRLAAATAILSR